MAGVRVGHTTIVEGAAVRTGVTAILPHGGNLFRDKVAAAVFVGNAFGKLAGSTQVQELGTLETPIVLTNTLAVGTAVEALVAHTLADPANADARSVNALVGETNDGGLNDIRGRHVTRDHVLAAVRGATGGAVGGRQRRRGNGHAGFRVEGRDRHRLARVAGRRRRSHRGRPRAGQLRRPAHHRRRPRGPRAAAVFLGPRPPTDGGRLVHGRSSPPTPPWPRAISSGWRPAGSSPSPAPAPRSATEAATYAIAFSTSPETRTRHGETTARTRTLLPSDAVSPLFQAVLEATEEAVYNAMLRAETMTGNGITVEALPLDRLRDLLAAYGRRR